MSNFKAQYTLCMFELEYLNDEYDNLIEAVQDIDNFKEEHGIKDMYKQWIFVYLNHLDNIYDFNDKVKEKFLNELNY